MPADGLPLCHHATVDYSSTRCTPAAPLPTMLTSTGRRSADDAKHSRRFLGKQFPQEEDDVEVERAAAETVCAPHAANVVCIGALPFAAFACMCDHPSTQGDELAMRKVVLRIIRAPGANAKARLGGAGV